MKLKQLAVLTGALLALNTATAAPTTIDFESTPTGIYSNLVIGDATITFTGGNGNFNVDNQTPGSPISGHNLISYFQNAGPGAFVVSFGTVISTFTIGSGDFNSDQDSVHLSAYDAFDNLIDTDAYLNPASQYGGSNMTVSGANIKYVKFWEDGPFPGAIYWDNISYESRGAAVPEPASLALFGLAFAGLAAARRRKHAK